LSVVVVGNGIGSVNCRPVNGRLAAQSIENKTMLDCAEIDEQ